METLLELAQIISKNKTKRIEIIGHPGNYNSRAQKLYEELTSNKELDEQALPAQLFPDSNNQHLSFSRLKQRLFKRLINTLFFIDTDKPSFTNIQRAYYLSYRDFAAFKILVGKSSRKVSIKLGERILKRSIDFEFTDLTVDLLRVLRVQYTTIEADRKKFERANNLFKKQKLKLEAEELADEYYSQLALYFVKSRAPQTELAQTARKYSQELKKLEDDCDTQRFYFISYYVHAIRYQIENDFITTEKICQRAIDLLTSKKKLINPNALQTFLNIKASANIKLGRYQEAQADIEQNLKLSAKGTLNWYISLYYLFLLHFHNNDYQKALVVFKNARENSQFKKLPPAHKEYWIIAEAYLYYLIAMGEIQLNLKDLAQYSNFRVQKFLNEVPVYSKDKRGANISILILQVLFLLQRKEYENTVSRLERLKSYSNKYLRKNENFRSNCFIRILLQLPNSYFNKKAALRKTQKYVERLKEVPLRVAVQSSEMELIPYEQLWQMVLKSLKG